jgi:hypothetical protein
MSRYFGRVPVNLVWRRGDQQHGSAGTFARIIRSLLNRRRPRSDETRERK